MHAVPQILTNCAEDFVQTAKKLEQYGYKEINLNVGCPSKTVVTKGRGAGFLAFPERLDLFLEEVFQNCPIDISVKRGSEQKVVRNFRNLWIFIISIR